MVRKFLHHSCPHFHLLWWSQVTRLFSTYDIAESRKGNNGTHTALHVTGCWLRSFLSQVSMIDGIFDMKETINSRTDKGTHQRLKSTEDKLTHVMIYLQQTHYSIPISDPITAPLAFKSWANSGLWSLISSRNSKSLMRQNRRFTCVQHSLGPPHRRKGALSHGKQGRWRDWATCKESQGGQQSTCPGWVESFERGRQDRNSRTADQRCEAERKQSCFWGVGKARCKSCRCAELWQPCSPCFSPTRPASAIPTVWAELPGDEGHRWSNQGGRAVESPTCYHGPGTGRGGHESCEWHWTGFSRHRGFLRRLDLWRFYSSAETIGAFAYNWLGQFTRRVWATAEGAKPVGRFWHWRLRWRYSFNGETL